MSDWPEGWYRDETPRRPAGDSMSNAPTAGYRGGAGQAYGAGQASSWPSQPPARTVPGHRSPEGPPDGWQPSRRRRRFGPKRIFQIAAAVVILVIVGAIAFYFYLNSKLTRVSALAATSVTSAGQNWLITGSTGSLTRQQQDQLHAGHNSENLSDTIMLLHLPASGTPVLVSIPRDSYVPIPGHGDNKINAAYVLGGPQLLIQTVQSLTGLRIDHYMGIGYTGLVSTVNAVGGVRMCLPGPMVDPNAGLNLPKGCQTLNGTQALAYVRSRQFALGDLQRVQDQRILLKAILDKVTSTGTLINPFAAIPAATGSASAITVDHGTQLYQLMQVAFALRNPVTTTVPFGGFANETVGAVVLWDQAKAAGLFHDLAADRPLPSDLVTGSKAIPTA
jgi:LCP family protein required for cell wall assembly